MQQKRDISIRRSVVILKELCSTKTKLEFAEYVYSQIPRTVQKLNMLFRKLLLGQQQAAQDPSADGTPSLLFKKLAQLDQKDYPLVKNWYKTDALESRKTSTGNKAAIVPDSDDGSGSDGDSKPQRARLG